MSDQNEAPRRGTEILGRIGTNLRRLREEKGWTEVEFGAKFGWEGMFVVQIEEGEINVRLWMMDRMAEVLECLPEKLVERIK